MNIRQQQNVVVKVNKKFRKPDLVEKKALQDLAEQISKMSPNLQPEELISNEPLINNLY